MVFVRCGFQWTTIRNRTLGIYLILMWSDAENNEWTLTTTVYYNGHVRGLLIYLLIPLHFDVLYRHFSVLIWHTTRWDDVLECTQCTHIVNWDEPWACAFDVQGLGMMTLSNQEISSVLLITHGCKTIPLLYFSKTTFQQKIQHVPIVKRYFLENKRLD